MTIDASLVRSLGRFDPSELDPAAIERELPARLPSCCRAGRLSVRIPQGVAPLDGNLAWHQDDGGPAGQIRHMVIWASEQPTELRVPDGTIVVPPPCELIWFDNDRVFHRQPAWTDETRRWFVAVRCHG